MSLSYGILGFLSYREMTGYDLAKIFHMSVNFFWQAQTSQIYFELNKLEKKKFVESRIVIQLDKPNKKIYSITEQGKREFLHWLCSEEQENIKGIKNEFLMKIFFSGCGTPENCLAMLKRFLADCQAYLAAMEKIPQNLKDAKESVDSAQSLYWGFAADFGNYYTRMCIAWAERCIKRLEELK